MILRKVDVDVEMKVKDEENFSSHEVEISRFHCQNFVSTGGQRATLVRHRLGVGGEVRGELDLTTRLGAGATVVLEGVQKLFEGTSENTNDLADSEDVFVEIPPGLLVTRDIFTVNRDPNASDSAITNLRLTNLDALAEVARRGGVPLTARHSGKVLDVAEASLEPGAPVVQFRGLDQPNQRFRIEPYGRIWCVSWLSTAASCSM